MSLFGTTFPAATTSANAFSTPWNFGTPAASTTAAQQQQPTLGAFASPFSSMQFPTATSLSTATTAVPAFGGFGISQQPQQLAQQIQLQPQTTIAPAAGLGGARTDVNLSGVQTTTVQSVKTPRETEVPAEMMAVVEILKQRIKENRDIAEEIASVDVKILDQLHISYRSACVECGKAVSGVQKMIQAAKSLKAESRQDLLDGEMAQRLKDALAVNYDYGAPLSYLLRLAANYEKLIVAYAEELQRLEKLIFGQQKTVSFDEIVTHLKKVESAFRYVTSKVYELDQNVQELKDLFKEYRRSAYGDAAKFFPTATSTTSSPSKKFERIEGPSPFSSSSNSAVLVIANALSRAQAGTGLVPNISLQAPAQPAFGTQSFLGFGTQQPQQQQSFSTSLFRPFGSVAPTTTTTTAATPFASGTLSFTSGLGVPTTTTTLATTTTASPWRFSSPFNTSSSGTLFGGSATNVGAVKPLGLATPLQQGTVATSSLQLLNPPLGSKRGKS